MITYNIFKTVGNRCIPMKVESILGIIEQSELIKAMHNIQLIGSINGVSGVDCGIID